MFAKENRSVVAGIVFPHRLSSNRTYTIQNNLRGSTLIKFWVKVFTGYWSANRRLKLTLKKGECFYGPFKGEFGHMLAHTLPFLMYLHKNGVKIHYCGLELHKPFLVDEKGESIVYSYRGLRDFFSEVPPTSNATVPPKDVQIEIEKFENRARESGLPFWDIGDSFYYWFVHRNWLSRKNTFVYRLDKFYGRSGKENSCVLLPRKGNASTNNGQPWDYEALAALLATYFDKVYICGHPAQVLELRNTPANVVMAVSSDNSVLLEKMSLSKLVVTQHSGVVYAGEFTGTDILMIYKGGTKVQDITSLNNTLRFKELFSGRSQIYYAFSEGEIIAKVEKLTKLKVEMK